MKKLMIAAAIVCAAAMSQAAAIAWKSGTLLAPNSTGAFISDGKLSSGVGATLYSMTAAQYGAVTTLFDGSYSAEAMKAFVTGLQDGTYGTAIDASKYEIGEIKKNAMTVTDNTGYSGTSEAPKTFYTAIIYDYTDANGDWFIANAAERTFEADIGKDVSKALSTFGGDGATGSFAIGGWVQTAAVPEPTSGLLLLLGVAGLALRRRRA